MPARPSKSAPIITKTEAKQAAVENLTILDVTAEPKTLAAAFAPKDHPRKIPPKNASIRRAFSS